MVCENLVLLSRGRDTNNRWKKTEMIEFPLHGLCYTTEPNSDDPHNRGQLVQCDLFTASETIAISRSAAVLERFFSNMDRSFAVEEALKELKLELASLKSNNSYDVARVDRRFRAYVMEFRLFLDHWKKYIGDITKEDESYGSAYNALYNDVTSIAYDNNDSYVLATVIRNYVVHGYDSINHAHINGVNNEVFIRRNDLFKVKVAASARPVIEKQDEEINLLKVAEESLTSLQSIHEQLVNFQISEEIGQAAVTLLNAKKRIDDAGIEAETWIIIEGKEAKKILDYQNGLVIQKVGEDGQPIEEPRILPRIAQGIDLAYRPLNWIGYIVVAQYIAKLWQDGEWKKIQEKYLR